MLQEAPSRFLEEVLVRLENTAEWNDRQKDLSSDKADYLERNPRLVVKPAVQARIKFERTRSKRLERQAWQLWDRAGELRRLLNGLPPR